MDCLGGGGFVTSEALPLVAILNEPADSSMCSHKIVDIKPLNTPEWLDDANFPRSGIEGYALLDGGLCKPITSNDGRRLCASWQPMSRMLVASSKNATMLPLVCLPEFKSECLSGYVRRLTITLTIVGLYIVFCVGLVFFFGFRSPLPLAMLLGCLLFLQIYWERKSCRVDAQSILQKARFFAWMFRNKRYLSAYRWSISFVVLMGLAQWIGQERFGRFDGLVAAYGTIYERVGHGELWRLLSGAFIHVSVAHFLSNALLLLFIAPFLFLFERWLIGLVFVAGCLMGAWLQWQINPIGDGLLGISGGVLALYGSASAVGYLNRKVWSAGFAMQLFMVGVTSMLASAFFGAQVSTMAHLTGFAVGIVVIAAKKLVTLR